MCFSFFFYTFSSRFPVFFNYFLAPKYGFFIINSILLINWILMVLSLEIYLPLFGCCDLLQMVMGSNTLHIVHPISRWFLILFNFLLFFVFPYIFSPFIFFRLFLLQLLKLPQLLYKDAHIFWNFIGFFSFLLVIIFLQLYLNSLLFIFFFLPTKNIKPNNAFLQIFVIFLFSCYLFPF